MLGAIIGDLAGSIYEYDEFKGKDVDRRLSVLTKDNLIEKDSFYSDDTILTIAILEAILDGKDYGDTLKEYGLNYYKDEPITNSNHFKYMFSQDFIKWCKGERPGNSMGNGALMRVSPVGYLFNDFNKISLETFKATRVSHDSPLAIDFAKVLTSIIYFGRKGYDKEEVKWLFYSKPMDLDKVRLCQEFDSTCMVFDKCVAALFESNSFEEALRLAVSLGGDTDTVGAITGSMAEAYYDIPFELRNKALAKLPDNFLAKLDLGYQRIKKL